MRRSARFHNESPRDPRKDINWEKLLLAIVSTCAIDVAIHFQYIPPEAPYQSTVFQSDIQTSQDMFMLKFSHSISAKMLFYSSLCRTIFLLLCYGICKQKAIPEYLKPHTEHVGMTVTFLFCALTVWRILWDSEPPETILYFAYCFLILLDILFISIGYSFTYHIVLNSGAIVENTDGSQNGDQESKKTKKDKNTAKERTVPFFTMLRKIMTWYKSEWFTLIIGYFLLAIGTSAQSIEPYLNSKIIDAINMENVTDPLPKAVMLFSICVLMKKLAMTLKNVMAKKVGSRVSMRAKSELYKSILKQEIGFFDQSKSDEILRRLRAFSSEMELMWGTMENACTTCFELVGLVLVMAKMSWRLSLILVMANYIIWLPGNIAKYFYRKQWAARNDIKTKLGSMASEAVRNIRTVRSFANEWMEAARYDESLEKLHSLSQEDKIIEPIISNVGKIFWLTVRATILLYGGHLIVIEQLTRGELVTFLLYMETMWNKFSRLIDWQSHKFFQMLFELETFFEYLERIPEIDIDRGKYVNEEMNGVLQFNNVSFSYPTRPDSEVLKVLSFSAEAGEVVALVGSSGGGKSTCVSLIERFYSPAEGSLILDGKPLEDYEHRFLHQQISLVSQEPVLFGGSIEDNIKYGKPDATHNEVVQAAKDANAHDFVTALSDGYDTDVGEGGSQLSGGQKQRIAIARALIRNPKIMLLDEATSALDAESENLVQEAIQNSMQGRTVIIIAHRLTTVEHADKIVVIDKGEVVEQGTHENLVSINGVYSRLVRKQLKTENHSRTNGLGKQGSDDKSSSSVSPEKTSDEGFAG